MKREEEATPSWPRLLPRQTQTIKLIFRQTQFPNILASLKALYLARLVKMVRRRDDGQLVEEDDGIVAVKGYIPVGKPPLCA
jgi:hypothetical protein